MTNLLIIGGSDAGISAALRAQELDPKVNITVVLADRFPNYSICGLPFFLSGEVSDWRQLAHRTEAEITHRGVHLLMEHRAEAIDPTAKTVRVVDGAGQTRLLPYDRLVIGTGAIPSHPPIEGLDLPGVFLLRSMADSFAVEEYLVQSQPPQSALIIGGGYIGLEMADALTHRGLAVTVVEHNSTVLKTVDASLGQRVTAELHHHGVEVVSGVAVESIAKGEHLHLHIRGTSDFAAQADMVLVSTGVNPSTDLALSAGIEVGLRKAIQVNQKMETSAPQIYAAGDCVETWHRLLQQPTYLPLGTTAHKQGRIAGANAVGYDCNFAGSLGTQVVKIFDLSVARTGLSGQEATAAGFDSLTTELDTWDHKAYYPGAQLLKIRLTGDQATGKLLGAQMVGHYQGEIAKRIDIFATALFHRMAVAALNDLDLSYTPPLGSPWDPVQMAAQAWEQCRLRPLVQRQH